MKIGYARASTDEQNLDLQIDALQADGCTQIFEDRGISGSKIIRPGLTEALSAAGDGHVLVVWRLDRLSRSLPHLIETLDALGSRGVEFRSLTESIDTQSAGGKLVFHMMGALAEFERSLISERTREGMKAAKKRGKHVGRPRRLDSHKIETARRLIETGEETQASVAALLDVSVSTLRRAL
ncbi:MAG: recombinase family protein [Pseudomonadota bacterium]